MTRLSLRPARRSLRAVLLATTLAVAALGAATQAPVWAGVPAEGYADLVERVLPSVVFIEVTQKATEQPTAGLEGLPPPLNEFLRRFGEGNPGFPQPDAPQGPGIAHGLGSGFIVSADGEIVTNNHVVEGASAIKVRLTDGREFTAHVVGTDPLTDVALIKLDKASDLPVARFGQSDALRVGDAVVAVGNPFGLGNTVTSGIVSAMGRNLNSGPYDSYIQTDAAINKGNSGGPLFNTAGDVIGMNTAIFSPSGGSVGIGFSVPATTIQNVVDQLRDHGSVARGWLGVSIQPVTHDLAQALGLAAPEGALVAEVLPDSPAAGTDLRGGDVIVAVNGKKVDESHGLPTIIAAIPAGQEAALSVLRDGKPVTVSVKVGTLTPEKLQLASAKADPEGAVSAPLGISVEALSPENAQSLGLGDAVRGVVISKIAPDSPNADRLRPGDVITEAAGQPVTSPQEFGAALKDLKGKEVILLKLNREGRPLFIGAEIAAS